MPKPVLYVVACGARPAADLPPFVTEMRAAGWDVCVIATPDGLKFIDRAELGVLTGHPVRSEYKQPDAPDILPPADAFAIAPATFNTVNKLAHGTSDTLALGLVNEGIGNDRPVVVMPKVSGGLSRHPAYRTSLASLREWGVKVVESWTDLADTSLALLQGAGHDITWPHTENTAGRGHA